MLLGLVEVPEFKDGLAGVSIDVPLAGFDILSKRLRPVPADVAFFVGLSSG